MTQTAAVPESVQHAPMVYLSVHDLVWINSTLTGKTLPFNYATLEEGMAAQYSYGRSDNVARQAANLLGTILGKRPFQYGNRRTAFVTLATFLTANGYRVKAGDEECARVVESVASGATTAQDAISQLAEPVPGTRGGASLRSLVTQLLNIHSEAVGRLEAGDR